MTDFQYFEKNGSKIQRFEFQINYYNEDGAKKFLKERGFETVDALKAEMNRLVYQVRPVGDFVSSSLRDVMLMDGIFLRIGLLKPEIMKAIQKNSLEKIALLKADELTEIYDLDITEITLTGSPAVGEMAKFRVMKSNVEQNFEAWIPIAKVDVAKRQVFSYAMVPHIPDHQSEWITENEIEKACHRFLKNMALGRQQGSGTGYEHEVFNKDYAWPIENYFDRNGVHGVGGGWWNGIQVNDENLWKKVEKGEISGVSVGGFGKRRNGALNLDKIGKTKESLTGEDVGILKRLVNFVVGQSTEQAEKPIEKQSQELEACTVVEKKEKNQMDPHKNMAEIHKNISEIVMKFQDLPPAKLFELANLGVDVKKAFDAIEQLHKAVNAKITNFNDVGWTSIKIIDAVKNGDYGSFATSMFAVGKSNPGETPSPITKSDSLQSSPDDVLAALHSDAEKIVTTMQEGEQMLAQIDSQIEQINGRCADVRKSTNDVYFPENEDQEPPDPEQMQVNWNSFEFTHADKDAVLKHMGGRKR